MTSFEDVPNYPVYPSDPNSQRAVSKERKREPKIPPLIKRDGEWVMDAKAVGRYRHLSPPNIMARIRKAWLKNPGCRKFFPGMPKELPKQKPLVSYDVGITKAGIEIVLDPCDSRDVLIRAFENAMRLDDPLIEAPLPWEEDLAQGGVPSALPSQVVDNITYFDISKLRNKVVDGEIYIVAKDLVESNGMSWERDHTVKHVPNEWKRVITVSTPGGPQDMLCLSEPGMWHYLVRSDSPRSLPLQKFISGQVLPSIRKTGSYGVLDTNNPAVLRKLLIDQTYRIEDAEARAARETERALIEEENAAREKAAREAAEAEKERLIPKAEYFDEAMAKNETYSYTSAAAILGISRLFLINELTKLGWHFRFNGSGEWHPYKKIIDAGLMCAESSAYRSQKEGIMKEKETSRITERGLVAIRLHLKNSDRLI